MSSPPPDPAAAPQFNIWKFLAAFVAVFFLLVGAWLWFFLGRSTGAQAYARQTLQAAQTMNFAPDAAPHCDEVTGQPLPSGVESCVLHPERGEVVLTLQGGREAVVSE